MHRLMWQLLQVSQLPMLLLLVFMELLMLQQLGALYRRSQSG